ncbi:MAG TPA: hypothetical protein IAB70_07570 [Candidatus Merdicola faecigallinarum]|uniref:Uncharacterized protein n=1 Tax=Candidatus Merdicola faecigallinarum TaxID=2840862 RepID=A0A9D1SA10_9FIRM|nr:hypothetical protein [Candidatus Merdicola faecigallinarum]
MNKLKENKGMTLVALILAIIILLVLAATVVYLVFGDNGPARENEQIATMQDKTYAEDMVKVGLKAVKRENANNGNTANTSVTNEKTDSQKMASLIEILSNTSFSKEADNKVSYAKDGRKYVVTVNFDNYTVTSVE